MMMASDSSKFPVWFTAFTVLLCLLVSGSSSAADLKNGSQCVDGTYQHEGLTCCLCAAGLHLKSHCTKSQTYGECKTCDSGQYSSHPTKQISCDPCRSCSQISAGLEVDEPCKPDADTKCRCKKGHYCDSEEICITCAPCEECGDVGIKKACTARTNTVCNDKIEGGLNDGAIAGILVAVTAILFLIGLVLAFLWKRRRDEKRRREHSLASQPNDVERQPLKELVPVVDLQSHMTDIAEAIGWRDMREVAMRSLIPIPTIESCELNHPGNSQEQTLELLKIWVEKQGREASKNLVQILEDKGKRGKAESVVQILS
ncbi:tumor necrosis factor receptor superfamily member 22 [Sebastes umbrosus]|uniref:tumor necrosis factor receptor superfamily member 22 n=1 Tax=Sebastes umbrosus TaxID=72105 RepID=UPI00189F3ED6|nr:tumor necrosis factor receptor superfamily member 22 [Sebastes umbrosus]